MFQIIVAIAPPDKKVRNKKVLIAAKIELYGFVI